VSPSSQESIAFGWEIDNIEKLYWSGTLNNWTIEKSGVLV